MGRLFTWLPACALLAQVVALGAIPSALQFTDPISFENSSRVSHPVMISYAGSATVRFTNRSFEITSRAGNTVVATFVNSRHSATPELADKLDSVRNYLIGNDPSRWRTGVPRFSRLRYRDLYPGMDIVFYGAGNDLEYDLYVQPGSDLQNFRLRIRGADSMNIEQSGDLVIHTGSNQLRWRKPRAYQLDTSGERCEVNSRYVLFDLHTLAIAVAPYDVTRPLIVDPAMVFSTYFGGAGNDAARGIGTDIAGNVYIAGYTTSMNLPVSASSFQAAYGGNTADYATGDVFVAKFSPTGALLYVTYLGGSADDIATALAVDSAGNAYITGFTNSSNFPVTANALQKTFAGSGGNQRFRFGDAFVAKLNPGGTSLVYSTYLGGSQDELGLGIAIDAAGDAYVTGTTLSANFPIAGNAVQRTFKGSGGQPQLLEFPFPFFVAGDAFVAELNPSGSGLIFSTFLGGSRDDTPLAIAVDTSGIYIAGATLSTDFPVTNGSFQQTNNGPGAQDQFFNFGDGFIAKLNSSGSAIIYATYLGGAGDDAITSIAVDGSGSAYVCGCTNSPNFPVTSGAYQTFYHGPTQEFSERIQGDAFAVKLNPAGSALVYGTYIGGAGDECATTIRVDTAGNAIIAGHTSSFNFPVSADALQKSLAGLGHQWNNGDDFGDGFIFSLNPAGSVARYASFFGGSFDDDIAGLALDSSGNVFATGSTVSTNLPVTTGAYQQAFGGSNSIGRLMGDAFVVKFSGLAQTNAPSIGGIASAASYSTTIFAPGEVVAIFGENLGPAGTILNAQIDPATGRLSASLSGAQVLFDGLAAPLVYVSAQQSSAIIPFEVAGKAATQVTAVYNGAQSAPFQLKLGTTAPGLFTNNQQGTGQAAVYNQDGSRNGADNPASAGSVIVLYGTGAGQFVPAGVTGQIIATSPPFPTIAGSLSVTVGGITVPSSSILYAGPVPGLVEALFQINLILPDGVPSGDQPIVITIDNASSQTNATVAVM